MGGSLERDCWINCGSGLDECTIVEGTDVTLKGDLEINNTLEDDLFLSNHRKGRPGKIYCLFHSVCTIVLTLKSATVHVVSQLSAIQRKTRESKNYVPYA